nr:UDP-N-acetylmuramoyl-tripeptide--D-alanyl-D-alanine ligase [Acidobacteriota bacterium]
DDDYVMKMRALHDGRTLTFGIDHQADVMAREIETATLGRCRFNLRTPLGQAEAVLPMPGRHNLMNALAASAVATCFEIGAEEIARSLRTVVAPHMRGEVLDFAAGFTVVDDSYNSNPRSLFQMVRTIAEGGAGARRHIVIAGEMLELGPEGTEMHREAGREMARAGIDVVWGVRGLAREIIEGAREAGMKDDATRFFETADEAATALPGEVREGDLVLIKGSRGVRTDKVVAALCDRFPLVGGDERI